MMTPLQQNASDLEQELAWFVRVLDTRFGLPSVSELRGWLDDARAGTQRMGADSG